MSTDLLVDQHAAAARQTIALARQASREQLTLPTTCAGWDLRQLLDHMTAENRGFAAAAAGNGADRAHWVGYPERVNPVGDYVAATEDLIEAFAQPGVLESEFTLPLLRAEPYPGELAVTMQLLDCVVHAWDLARTLDLPVTVDDEVATIVLAMSEQIPDSEARRRPDSSFAPRVPVADDAPVLDRIVALLGRSPSWPD